MLKRVYLFAACWTVIFCGVTLWQHSSWHKEALYRKLISGTPEQQISAAMDLLDLGSQNELVRALRAESNNTRALARKTLWSLWFNEAGYEVNQRMIQASLAAEHHHTQQAFEILDDVISRNPRFAEGWNQRAFLYWQLHNYQKSVADCREVVRLNPCHFGAWNGLAMCQFHLGEYGAARESIRIVLLLDPHNQEAKKLLQQCDELLGRSSRQSLNTLEI